MACLSQQLADALKVPVQSKQTRLLIIYRYSNQIDWSKVDSSIVGETTNNGTIVTVSGWKFIVANDSSKTIFHI